MHVQIGLLNEMFQDISGKVIDMREDLCKLDWEIGAMSNAIDIAKSKFVVLTNSLGSDLKKLASIVQ